MYLNLQKAFSKIIFQYGGLPLIPNIDTNFVVVNETTYTLLSF